MCSALLRRCVVVVFDRRAHDALVLTVWLATLVSSWHSNGNLRQRLRYDRPPTKFVVCQLCFRRSGLLDADALLTAPHEVSIFPIPL